MIAFSSVFLGLIVGVMPVSVIVQSPVALVRIELDGRPVGVMRSRPWTLPVDFGTELLPHELVGRAFDVEGSEIGLTRQFVNLPPPPAEVEILLEKDSNGQARAARFSSRITDRPAQAQVTFDGKPILPTKPNRVELPLYDPHTTHLLTVELKLSAEIRSSASVAIGAGESSVTGSDLTAVAIRTKSPSQLQDPAALAGALVSGGHALPVAAVEEGSALVCIVDSPSASRWFAQSFRESSSFYRFEMRLEKGDSLRFLWPIPRSVATAPGAALFDRAGDFTASDGGVLWFLNRVTFPRLQRRNARIADAASVAGLEAVASGNRRAVVLLLGGDSSDHSRLSPVVVRRYLESIRVPLFTWSVEKDASTSVKNWGPVEDVSSAPRLERAVSRLKKELASQRIVWLRGHFLPQDIALSNQATSLEFAR